MILPETPGRLVPYCVRSWVLGCWPIASAPHLAVILEDRSPPPSPPVNRHLKNRRSSSLLPPPFRTPTWHERYFVCRGNELFYYKTKPTKPTDLPSKVGRA